jgi:hypothetical protein
MKPLLPIFLMFVTASSLAAELVPLQQDGNLGVRIVGSKLPDSLRRDLTSGLTNRLMIRVTLQHGGQELGRRSAEIAVRYDLWDEQFIMTTQVGAATIDSAIYRGVQQVLDSLEEIHLPDLFSTSNVSKKSELTIRAEMLLNPVDRERMDAIRKWVKQNSARPSLDPAGAMAVADMSISNAIFNRIFEQYAQGSDVAAVWKQALETRTFRPMN